MKKLLLLLILSFFSAQSFAGSCPDGSEPVKSISADGTYFVYNCGGSTTSSSVNHNNIGTVKVAIKPDTGDWLNESIYPITLKEKMRMKFSNGMAEFIMGDFDNDGIDDILVLGRPNIKNLITGEQNSEITINVACDVSSGSTSNCYSSEKHRVLNIFSMKDNVAYEKWNGKKQKWDKVTGFQATDVSNLIVTNNPIEMSAQGVNHLLTADFNGDGVLDIFFNDAGIDIWDGHKSKMPGKNDHYYLSQPDGTWLESTVTHVTGTGVKKGRGLKNFTHGLTAGDIDNDGDIDIIVTSLKWVGNNGQLLCYVNQGDGHMKVRRCAGEFGWAVELGDVDNDGDLDIVFGSGSHQSMKEWKNEDGMNGCASYNNCPRGTFNGILLNDGTGNFFKRGFEFPDVVDSSNGFTYHMNPFLAVADLDGDGDLDVVRSVVHRLYQGMTMSIEENIGNGQFRTVFQDRWCEGPPTKAEWPTWEGGEYGCTAPEWKFGDFNDDGLVDIVVDGSFMLRKNHLGVERRIIDGTVYLSTGKFTYDTIHPDDKDYPLADIGVNPKKYKKQYNLSASEQSVEDELAAFEAELEEELAVEAEDAVAKRKAKVAAAKAKRLAEEAAKAAEADTVDTEQQSVEDEIAAFEAELAAELGE